MKIADGELRQILLYDLKLSSNAVRELVADSRQSHQPLLKVVLAAKAADDTAIARAHAKRIGIPYVNLHDTEISSKNLTALPYQLAARYKAICFDQTATSVKLAMADPRDEKARKALRDYFGKTIRRYLATDHDLTGAMRHYRKQDNAPLLLSTRHLLSTIIEQASRNGSRDIHFEPQTTELIIKRRVGKQLLHMSSLPIDRYQAILSWCKAQSGGQIANHDTTHNGTFTLPINRVRHTIVVAITPTLNGEKMTLRIIPPSESIPTLQRLGYGPKDTAYMRQIIKDGRGLIIIAGGNGSDTATTLASLAAEAAKIPATTVCSIENKVTYQIAGVNQTELTHAVSQNDILSTVLAQSPSTIIISELGSSASAEQLLDFSLSQHLVISGMYATNLGNVLTKLMRYPVAPALIAASLRLLIVQHQIEALCHHCRIPFEPTGPLKKVLWEQFSFNKQTNLYRKGPGCNYCQNKHQTILATEWLPITTELQQLIATKADTKALDTYISKQSDYTIHLGKLAAKGLISIDEATRQAY